MGHAAFDQSAGGGGFGGAGFGGGGFSDIFDQMFSEFSGGGGGRQRNQGGNDLRYDMSISLEDAFTGLQQDISITVPSECDGCLGSGAADGSKPSTCGTCGGAGRVRAQQGFFAVERTCHACQGMGQVISTRAGLVAVKAVFNVPKHWRFRFRPVLILAPGSGFRARAKLGFVVGRQVIFIFLSMLTLIRSLPVMVAICMREFPCQ